MQTGKLKIHKSKWSTRRILVTGHTGFMGSWLCLVLKKLGCEVWGVSLEPATKPNLFSSIQSLIDKHLIIDIRNQELLQKTLKNEKFDYVFHLAAQPLVRRSYDFPVETFATNVMGTAHILNLAKENWSPKACLVVTSDKCYKNQEWLRPYQESDPLGGHDPYSASKAATEIVVESYRKSFFEKLDIPLASVRAGNIIGGGDWSEARIVPDLMTNLLNGKPVEIRSPESTRPWQHVLEPLFVYIGLMDAMTESKSEFSKAWNIGPDEKSCRNVKELSLLCCEALGVDSKKLLKIKPQNQNDLHEAKLLQIDSNMLRKTFKWAPTLSFEDTIQWTVSWYKEQNKGANASELCQKQIDQYIRLSADSFDYMI
jgi:CDP-glucose 4,6-dehydratase